MTHVEYILKTLRPHRKRLMLSVVAMLGIMMVDLGSPLVLAVLIDKVVGQGRYHLLLPLMPIGCRQPFQLSHLYFSYYRHRPASWSKLYLPQLERCKRI